MKMELRKPRAHAQLTARRRPVCPGNLCRTNSSLFVFPEVSTTSEVTFFWPSRCIGIRQMFRVVLPLLVLALGSHSLRATTLAYASLDELIVKSSQIVRGTVQSLHGEANGSRLNTRVRISVVERWKGPESSSVDVILPGGTVGRTTQAVSGTPDLRIGAEYVFFLWTGRSGTNQLLGLSQGVLRLAKDSQGQASVSRPPAAAAMVDASTGTAVEDPGVSLTLAALRQRIQRVLGNRSNQ